MKSAGDNGVIRGAKSVAPPHLIELRVEGLGVVEYKLHVGRPAKVDAVKPSDGASMAKRNFIGDQSFSEAVIGARNHVENTLLWPANYLRVIQRPIICGCGRTRKCTDGWRIDPVLTIIQEVGE